MTCSTTKTRQERMIIVALALVFAAGSVRAAGNQRVTGFRTLENRFGTSQPVSNQSWDDVSRQSSSPEDVCTAVKSWVKYSQDMLKEDEWRSGKDTWEKREGDCEDFAAAVKDLSKEKGFKAEIYVVHSKTARASHAVTIGEVNGTMWISSNGSYEEVKSVDDAKQKLARDLGWWAPEVEVSKVAEASKQSDRDIQDASYTWK